MDLVKHEKSFISQCWYDNLPYFCLFSTWDDMQYHCHTDFYEFAFISSGTFRHNFNGIEETLAVGDLIFVRPGEYHLIYGIEPGSTHYAFIIKDTDFFAYCQRHLDDYSRLTDSPILYSKLSGAQTAYLSALGSAFARCYDPEKKPIAEQLLSALLFAIQNPLSSGDNFGVEQYARDLCLRFDNYQLLMEDITEIYTYYPVSQSTLISYFKQRTGMTIVEYRNKKRMEYAAWLLETEDYQITTVANMVHLSCLSYFSRMFKAQYGITPKQYQKLHLKKRK